MVPLIFLNGIQKKLKEFMEKLIKADFLILEFMFITNPLVLLLLLVPWNFPIILASRKISTALAAGCSVIVKPDVITPGSVMELVRYM